MKKTKIIRIRDLNHLRDQKLLLEEKIEEKEEKLKGEFSGFVNFIKSGDIVKIILGGSQLKADLLIHILPLILKYKSEIVNSELVKLIKQKINKKQIAIMSIIGAGLRLVGYKYFKKD